MEKTRQRLPAGLAAMPPGPRLAAVLTAIDLTLLSGADCVEVLRAQHRQASHEQARLMAAMVEVAICGVGPDDALPRMDAPDDFSADEIRGALAWTRAAASNQLSLAWDLINRLPRVFAALETGGLDVPKARVFAEWTYGLTDGQAHQICAQLLADAPTLTTGQLIDRIKKLAIAVDPDWARRRYAEAIRDRKVVGYRNEDGSANVSGQHLPADRAAAACGHIDALARKAKRAGDARRANHIRADLFLGMLDGSYTGWSETAIIDHLLATADPQPADTAHNPARDVAHEAPHGSPHDTVDDGAHNRAHNAPHHAPHDAPPHGSPHDAVDDAVDNGAHNGRPHDTPPHGSPHDTVDDAAHGRPPNATHDAPHHAVDDGPPQATPHPAHDAPHDATHDAARDVAHDALYSPTDDTPHGAVHNAPRNPAARGGGCGGRRGDRNDLGHDFDAAGEGKDPAPDTSGRHDPARTPPPTRRVGIEIRAEITTLLGFDHHPGEIAGWGPVTADVARRLVHDQTAAEWRFAITDDAGRLQHEGITRYRPDGYRPRAASPCRGGVVELQVKLSTLRQLANRLAGPEVWAKIITDLIRQAERLEHEVGTMLQAQRGRSPGRALRRRTQIRDRTCVHPGCRSPARGTDGDHTQDWANGGATREGNIGSACRHDHRLKHEGGWTVIQPRSGHFVWISRLGRHYHVRPPLIIPPLPDPVPRVPPPAYAQNDHEVEDEPTWQEHTAPAPSPPAPMPPIEPPF